MSVIHARGDLERNLRDAEAALGVARESAIRSDAVYKDLLARGGGRARQHEATEARATAEADVAEATAQRDEILASLSKGPISRTINGHSLGGEQGYSEDGPRGLGVGFTREQISAARAHLLGDNPAPLRLGPSLGGDDGGSGLMAVTDTGDWAQGLVGSYDIAQTFPWLREMPSVASIFLTDTIDRASRIYYRFNAAADQAAVVAESAGKPESNPGTEAVTVTPQVVAHYGKFTRQNLLNAPNFLDQYISEFIAGLQLAVDQQLVSGTGSGQLNGIMNAPGVLTYTRDTTNELRADAILSAITKVRINAFREPTHLIIHPTDLESVRKEHFSSVASYNFAPVASLEGSGTPRNVWGLIVVATTSATLGTPIVIDPITFGNLVVRLPVIAEVDPFSLFTTNQFQLRCETMLDLCSIRGQAACLISDM
jgi:hypothetical protein